MEEDLCKLRCVSLLLIVNAGDVSVVAVMAELVTIDGAAKEAVLDTDVVAKGEDDEM